LDILSAFSAGSPCELLTPRNFEKLSIEKKIKVSEAIRECERKLIEKPRESENTNFGSPQTETRTFEYRDAVGDRRVYHGQDLRAASPPRETTSISR
jgi:hypothetical protein